MEDDVGFQAIEYLMLKIDWAKTPTRYLFQIGIKGWSTSMSSLSRINSYLSVSYCGRVTGNVPSPFFRLSRGLFSVP